jgi:microcystin-dependent protein
VVDPFLAEIGTFAFGMRPKFWAFCNGAALPINQNQPLFSLLGWTYAPELEAGRVQFAVPNLRGRSVVGVGPGFALAQTGGAEAVTLTSPQLAAHTHRPAARSAELTTTRPAGRVPGQGGMYGEPDGTALHPSAIDPAGGGQPHENMAPHLVLNFCIATAGVFPSAA